MVQQVVFLIWHPSPDEAAVNLLMVVGERVFAFVEMGRSARQCGASPVVDAHLRLAIHSPVQIGAERFCAPTREKLLPHTQCEGQHVHRL